MNFFKKNIFFSNNWLKDYAFIIAGSFVLSLGYVLFIPPYKIVPGGVYGVGIVVHYLTKNVFEFWPEGVPIGLFGLALNIPLTIIGIKILGPRFGIKTVIGFVLSSFFIDLITFLRPNGDAPFVDDTLLSCIFGGVLLGTGLGLIFKSRATSGGSDIIAMIIEKYTHISLGKLMMFVDSSIVLIALIVFQDWKIPLYSWIVIFIAGKSIDFVLKGSNSKAILIVSKEHHKIREKIMNELQYSGTYFKAEELVSDQNKGVIFIVLHKREVIILEKCIHQIDPKAFITVLNTHEVYGKRFNNLIAKFEN